MFSFKGLALQSDWFTNTTASTYARTFVSCFLF